MASNSLCIFASGQGTNTQSIIDYFRGNKKIKIGLIVSNNPEAGVLNIAKKEQIPYLAITKADLTNGGYLEALRKAQINWVILAGFLLKIPSNLIQLFPDKIINIHPALLPAYGGKGMYGMHVHEAVINNKEKKSGITIHLVNQNYDEGKIIFQKSVDILPGDTPESLAEKIHILEHKNFAPTIEKLISEEGGF